MKPAEINVRSQINIGHCHRLMSSYMLIDRQQSARSISTNTKGFLINQCILNNSIKPKLPLQTYNLNINESKVTERYIYRHKNYLKNCICAFNPTLTLKHPDRTRQELWHENLTQPLKIQLERRREKNNNTGNDLEESCTNPISLQDFYKKAEPHKVELLRSKTKADFQVMLFLSCCQCNLKILSNM